MVYMGSWLSIAYLFHFRRRINFKFLNLFGLLILLQVKLPNFSIFISFGNGVKWIKEPDFASLPLVTFQILRLKKLIGLRIVNHNHILFELYYQLSLHRLYLKKALLLRKEVRYMKLHTLRFFDHLIPYYVEAQLTWCNYWVVEHVYHEHLIFEHTVARLAAATGRKFNLNLLIALTILLRFNTILALFERTLDAFLTLGYFLQNLHEIRVNFLKSSILKTHEALISNEQNPSFRQKVDWILFFNLAQDLLVFVFYQIVTCWQFVQIYDRKRTAVDRLLM